MNPYLTIAKRNSRLLQLAMTDVLKVCYKKAEL